MILLMILLKTTKQNVLSEKPDTQEGYYWQGTDPRNIMILYIKESFRGDFISNIIEEGFGQVLLLFNAGKVPTHVVFCL